MLSVVVVGLLLEDEAQMEDNAIQCLLHSRRQAVFLRRHLYAPRH